jgi:hypothetical protein
VPVLRVRSDRHDQQGALDVDVLALSRLRRDLESGAFERRPGRPAPALVVANPAASREIDEMRELIAALDRRVPRLERTGEVEIARDAAALRRDALARIADLQQAASSRE